MKMTFKNLIYVLKRFKTSSILNILGLSAALVVFTICVIQTHHDLTFNGSLKNVDRLYQMSIYQETNYGTAHKNNMPFRSSETIRLNQPIFDKTNLLRVVAFDLNIKYEIDNQLFMQQTAVTSVEPQFLDIIGLEIIKGDARYALNDINKVIISEKTAKKFFGDKDPIGKYISISMPYTFSDETSTGNSWKYVEMSIAAVYKDFPTNTSFNNGIFTLLDPDRFEVFSSDGKSSTRTGSFDTYCLLNESQRKNEIENILSEKQLTDLLQMGIPRKEEIKDAVGEGNVEVIKEGISLISLSNIQISHPEIVPNKAKSWTSILSLIAIGISTLLIAYINFMNFITAMAPIRIRSINIQKILGANRISLIVSIIFETIFFTIFSFAIALLCIYFLSTSFVSEFFKASLLPNDNIEVLISIGCILIIISILVALYPAYYLTSHKPITSYGGAGKGEKGKSLRNILTTIQFLAASILILVALFINLQHQYFKTYDLGIKSTNVIEVKNHDNMWKPVLDNIYTYMQEASISEGVINSTAANFSFGRSGLSQHSRSINNLHIRIFVTQTNKNFLDFFDIKVLEGTENLNIKGDNIISAVNQKAVELYGIETIESYITKKETIVIKDFNFLPLYEEIKPLEIMLADNPKYPKIYFKISGQNVNKTIDYLESIWKKFTTAPFEYQFMDEIIDQHYKQEKDLAMLLSIFALTSIIIAIMGVYGLITFNSKYRAKEIAIRKVQGSSISQIMLLLNQGVLIQFAIAYVIAIPIAYYIISKWLEQFIYRTPMHWTIFLLGAFIILAITLLTVSVQSYRAATQNPVKTLKTE